MTFDPLKHAPRSSVTRPVRELVPVLQSRRKSALMMCLTVCLHDHQQLQYTTISSSTVFLAWGQPAGCLAAGQDSARRVLAAVSAMFTRCTIPSGERTTAGSFRIQQTCWP
ncbi:unnamed protein product [Pleuronectes platessa]|uniref:Uncharacterized protein n=1 Tax=Pleuronectes platessa TaxID=8262 RepID=A0A9N7TIU0_PLEPL|nr:unnamed protein product [Pleuronectes platessa]